MIGTNLDEAKLFTHLDPGINEMVKSGGEDSIIAAGSILMENME